MITTRGEAKIVDFGIAKLTGADLTRTGTSLGTVAYMAPEQFHGLADARADLWALGVVLHEMLAGCRPFEGRDDIAVMNAILNQTPPPIRSIRADVPERLAAVVGRALQKDPGARYATAQDMVTDLEAARPQAAGPGRIEAPSALRVLLRPMVALPLLVVIGLLGYIAVTTLMAQSRARRAREVTIPEITRLVGIDEYAKAYDLAQQANRAIPNDPMLASLMAQMTAPATFTVTRPAVVRVSVKPYAAPEAEWRPVEGATPAKALLPRGAYRWRLEADGFQTAEFARNVGDGGPGKPATIELAQAGEIPDGMVLIPGAIQGRRAAAGGLYLSRHAARGGGGELRAAHHPAGADAGGPLRSPVPRGTVAGAAVQPARDAGRPEADGALRRRPRRAAARPGDQREPRLAGSPSRPGPVS
jgi:hypothetical protein